MEATLIVMTTAFVCLCCFIVGAKVGQKVSKDEPIEIPTVNPMKAVREHRAKKEAEMEQDRLDTIIANIEKYDGTGRGQEDVPRG